MNKLDNFKIVKKIDCSGMLKFISNLPEQCRDAYLLGNSISVNKIPIKINNIVFAGMGGSGIGADIVQHYLRSELTIPVLICRNYCLPNFVGEGTLLFCSSYSGNTEETLSCFEHGLKKRAFIITIGSGGILKEMSLKNNATHVDIPAE